MAVAIADVKNRMGADRYNAYCYDSSTTGAKTADQIAQYLLDSAVLWAKAKATATSNTYSDAGVTDESKITNDAVIYYAIYLIYCYANNQETGEDEKNKAYELLSCIWGAGVIDSEKIQQKPTKLISSFKAATGKKLDVLDLSGDGYTNDYALANLNTGLIDED